MMKPCFTYITAFLLCLFCLLPQAIADILVHDNPFMSMTGRKYADYSQELDDEYYTFLALDTIEALNVIRQLEDVARTTGKAEWKLHAGYYELLLFDMKRSRYGNQAYPLEEMLRMGSALLEKTKKENVVYLELIVRQKMIDYYWVYRQDYAFAFEQYAVQEKRLQTVLSEEIPEKSNYYRLIADAFYAFKDYSKAIYYYTKTLEEKDNIRTDLTNQHARNGLGLCYRHADNDLDRSDSCFHAIMQVNYFSPENERFSDAWNGIAQGNIGYNMLLRGEYDTAIPLLESSIEKMLKFDDYAYASGPAIHLADIYLKKNNLQAAKRYIDLARDYYQKMPRDGRLPRIYEVMSKYYAAIGNATLSTAYIDSTLAANRQYEEQFNTMVLLRMEQKESAQREQELVQEKDKRQQAQLRILILFIAFMVIFALSVFLLALYRRNRAAYRVLVRKSQEWAQVSTGIDKPETTLPVEDSKAMQPLDADLALMATIERLMSEKKPYKDASLSVETLAQTLGVKKQYLSDAIHRCTKKNFNTFVNEYRIKESIRLLSETNLTTFSFSSIVFESGFNEDRTFRRVFRKMTGLSPTDFRKNRIV